MMSYFVRSTSNVVVKLFLDFINSMCVVSVWPLIVSLPTTLYKEPSLEVASVILKVAVGCVAISKKEDELKWLSNFSFPLPAARSVTCNEVISIINTPPVMVFLFISKYPS